MKKVTIYTLADRRPDFIEAQYNSFKKYLVDEWEYVVINNAVGFMGSRRRKIINAQCKKLGIETIQVTKKNHLNNIGGEIAINWFGSYTNPNVACAYPIQFVWEKICNDNKNNICVLIDSDMFLCKKTSFNEILTNSPIGYIAQYRGLKNNRMDAKVTYPWNGIFIWMPSNTPEIRSLRWDCGVVENFPVDVGGYGYIWLNNHSIKPAHISEYAIHEWKILDNKNIMLRATLNGNYHFSFEYTRTTKSVLNFKCYEQEWEKDDGILPHFPKSFQSILIQKTISYFEHFIENKQTYPNPTFLGFIEKETFSPQIDPFIIHNKAGSGYMGFNREYGTLKLGFIRNLLDI